MRLQPVHGKDSVIGKIYEADAGSQCIAAIEVVFAARDVAPGPSEIGGEIRVIVQSQETTDNRQRFQVWWWSMIDVASGEKRYLQSLVVLCPNAKIVQLPSVVEQ